MSSTVSLFREALSRYSLLKNVSSVLVGFSGGSDSSALLDLLSHVDRITVYAVHVNHCIRGNEADRDEKFCEEFCRERGIKFFSLRFDIPEYAERNKLGIEEAARIIRYSFFENIRITYGIDVIATAHNATDNIETVIMNLVRGTSITGLCGIPPKRDNIIRPLILCKKEDTENYCNENGIRFVVDSTNNETAYRRNYVRHNILPLLKELNPSVESVVSFSSDIMRSDKEYLESVSSLYSFDSGRDVLSSLHDSILSRVLISELKKNSINPEKKHIDEITDILRSDRINSSVSLPGSRLFIDRNKVCVSSEEIDFFPVVLKPGINTYGGHYCIIYQPDEYDFSKDINKLKNIYKLSIQATFDSAKIKGLLIARQRAAGDVIFYGGMHHSLKKLLQAKKMPLSERRALPVISDDNGVIIVPGLPVRDGLSSNNGTVICIFNTDRE